MKTFILFTLTLSILCIEALRSRPIKAVDPHQIVNLPGLNVSINFDQYAGYLTVNGQAQRRLFYWFVESQNSPKDDPVVLWLNGGPGCSSLAGLLSEHGPFRPNWDGKTVSVNPHSWNRVANVLYLESPAGVGFSYSKDQQDYSVGDSRTADDVYKFLLEFYKKFPQFKTNPFYVSGESYGGHYVPTTVKRIRDGNQVAAASQKINLAGFLVGNAWTYMPIDNRGAVDYWWSHALISDESHQKVTNSCDFTSIGPLGKRSDQDCNIALAEAQSSFYDINIYDIYVDVCHSSSRKYIDQYAKYGSPVHVAMAESAQKSLPYEPCIDTFVSEYLNQASVRKALHALETDYQWSECSGIITYNYSDVEASVIPLYQEFVAAADMKILVFSGDVDAIVPVTGTRAWLATLNLPVVKKWTSWTVSQQVGGFVTQYEGLTFATVRNAGHMVPATQPERAFALFERFLKNGNLDA